MEIEQSAFINEKSDDEIAKENEERKEKQKERNREKQRAWRHRNKKKGYTLGVPAEVKSSFFVIYRENAKSNVEQNGAMAPWLEFPHEITDVTNEEDKMIRKCLLGYTKQFVRVGKIGYVMPGDYRKHAEAIYNLQVRPDDTFVITFPRSGTTWVQELIWLVENNLDFNRAKSEPLYKRFPMLEITTQIPKIASELIKVNFLNLGNFQGLGDAVKEPSWQSLASAPSPRFIKTHLPLSLLPPSLLSTARVVYVARDPRDVAVSYYYLHKMVAKSLMRSNFNHFWETFRRDLMPYCPVIQHTNEAWLQRHNPNLHLIFYEDLIKDLPKEIRSACNFLHRDYTDKQIKELADHLSFASIKKNKNVNDTHTENREGLEFVRKGEAGGWQTHFDEKQQIQAEEFLIERLQGLDLKYKSFPLHEITRL